MSLINQQPETQEEEKQRNEEMDKKWDDSNAGHSNIKNLNDDLAMLDEEKAKEKRYLDKLAYITNCTKDISDYISMLTK